MNNEKYLNYYIELLSNSISEALLKNISLQANSRISDEIICQLSKTIEEQKIAIENLTNQNKNVMNDNSQTIQQLKNQVVELSSLKSEYENTKHQIQHLDTFKNEIVRCRKENEDLVIVYEKKIKELNDKIDYLQLPPAKRKKIDEASASIKIQQINISKASDDF